MVSLLLLMLVVLHLKASLEAAAQDEPENWVLVQHRAVDCTHYAMHHVCILATSAGQQPTTNAREARTLCAMRLLLTPQGSYITADMCCQTLSVHRDIARKMQSTQ